MTLARVLAVVDPAMVRPVSVPDGTVEVTDAVLADAAAPLQCPPGAVVLAVGTRGDGPGGAQVLRAAREAGAAAVVFRAAPPNGDGVAVLEVGASVGWADARTALIDAIAVRGRRDGALFDVADAVAALVGRAVAVEDAAGEVIAYATVNSPAGKPVRRGWAEAIRVDGRLAGRIVVVDDGQALPADAVDLLRRAARAAAEYLRPAVDAAPRPAPSPLPLPAAEVHSRAFLHHFEGWLADHDELSGGKVDALLQHDERNGTHYAASLEAHLRAFGDTSAAAGAVHVNRKSFRYRLRRVVELSGIDLADPEERLVAHLQLRSKR
jgi:hypothetical protein